MPSELHNQLCHKAAKFLQNNGFAVSFHDQFSAVTSYGEQPDAIGFRNGVSCLIEVKVSRADFLADGKKRVRFESSKGVGDWRFYLAPQGLMRIEELPQGWGLLEFDGRVIRKTHSFPPNTQWFTHKPFNGNKQAECDYQYSALRRIPKIVFNEYIYGVNGSNDKL